MSEILNLLKSPEFYAVALALVAALRVIGDLFIAIGNLGKLKDKEDWFDSAGAFIRNIANRIGKGLAWLGIGNKK